MAQRPEILPLPVRSRRLLSALAVITWLAIAGGLVYGLVEAFNYSGSHTTPITASSALHGSAAADFALARRAVGVIEDRYPGSPPTPEEAIVALDTSGNFQHVHGEAGGNRDASFDGGVVVRTASPYPLVIDSSSPGLRTTTVEAYISDDGVRYDERKGDNPLESLIGVAGSFGGAAGLFFLGGALSALCESYERRVRRRREWRRLVPSAALGPQHSEENFQILHPERAVSESQTGDDHTVIFLARTYSYDSTSESWSSVKTEQLKGFEQRWKPEGDQLAQVVERWADFCATVTALNIQHWQEKKRRRQALELASIEAAKTKDPTPVPQPAASDNEDADQRRRESSRRQADELAALLPRLEQVIDVNALS